MKQKTDTTKFVKHILDNNFAAADKVLQGIVNEKLKERIRTADKALANNSLKKS